MSERRGRWEVDRYGVDHLLAENYEYFVHSLGNIIDADAGLHEVTMPSHFGRYVDDVGQALDLEAGLAAIVGPDAAEKTETHAIATPQSAVKIMTLVMELRPAARLRSRSIVHALEHYRKITVALEGSIRRVQVFDGGIARAYFEMENERRQRDERRRIRSFDQESFDYRAASQVVERRAEFVAMMHDAEVSLRTTRQLIQALDDDAIADLDAAMDPEMARQREFVVSMHERIDAVHSVIRSFALLVEELKIVQLGQAIDKRSLHAITEKLAELRGGVLSGKLGVVRAYLRSLIRSAGHRFGSVLGQPLQLNVDDITGLDDKSLTDAVDNMVGADLRDAQLLTVNLAGVRWSGTTQWPDGWYESIRADSVLIDESKDVWEIRPGAGSTNLPTDAEFVH